jgi:cyanate lyase
MSLTLVGLASATAGNKNSGVLAPNQGQIPAESMSAVAANLDLNDESLEKIEKALLKSIYDDLKIDPLTEHFSNYTEQMPEDNSETTR